MPDPTRSLQWRLAAPTDGQLALLARYGIDVPDNATRGLVSDMLDHCRAEMGPPEHLPRGRWYEDADYSEFDDVDDDDFNDREVNDDEGARANTAPAAGAAEPLTSNLGQAGGVAGADHDGETDTGRDESVDAEVSPAASTRLPGDAS